MREERSGYCRKRRERGEWGGATDERMCACGISTCCLHPPIEGDA